MWRRERLLPNPAIGAGPAGTIAFAMQPAKFLLLPTSAVDASRSNHPGTVQVDRAIWLLSAEPTISPPDRIDSMPKVGLVRPCVASAQETTGPIHSNAYRPTELPPSSASCQKINKLPASNISTCSEAEPIYATSSRTSDELNNSDGSQLAHSNRRTPDSSRPQCFRKPAPAWRQIDQPPLCHAGGLRRGDIALY
jgi:hypothetical protein